VAYLITPQSGSMISKWVINYFFFFFSIYGKPST